jgi:glucose dehydrogenase
VLVAFNKNGFAYTIDRATGEVLVAEPYVHVNWAEADRPRDGRPVLDSTKLTGKSRGMVQQICPSLEGGKSPASPASYSPQTGYFYVSTNNLCMSWQSNEATYIPGTPYVGANVPYTPGPGGYLGALVAWDASQGKKVWTSKRSSRCGAAKPPRPRAVVVGFYGTLDGWLKAADAKTGKPLWKFKVGSGDRRRAD